MDELAAQLLFVISNFGLKSIIGFGVGAGANILARFALNHSEKVGALCLINCNSTTSGWMEWGYQSFNARYLRSKGMTQGVVDYLMWHHFGRNPEERNHDLAQVCILNILIAEIMKQNSKIEFQTNFSMRFSFSICRCISLILNVP